MMTVDVSQMIIAIQEHEAWQTRYVKYVTQEQQSANIVLPTCHLQLLLTVYHKHLPFVINHDYHILCQNEKKIVFHPFII